MFVAGSGDSSQCAGTVDAVTAGTSGGGRSGTVRDVHPAGPSRAGTGPSGTVAGMGSTEADRPLRFYVAGKAGGGEDLVRGAGERLRARGWDWTMDWTGIAVATPYLDHADTNAPVAAAMLAAVAASDLVVLVPGPGVFGALLETGAALAAGTTVAVLGSSRESIFWCLPHVELVTDLDALDDLAGRVEARHR